MRLFGVVMVAVVLAGCSTSFFGGCPPRDSVSFTHATLYGALPEAAAEEGLDVDASAPTGGIPFEGGDAIPAEWGGASLRSVRWTPDGGVATREMLHVSMSPTVEGRYSITVSAPAEMGQDEVRDVFHAFLDNVSTADDAQRDAWTSELLHSRQPFGWTGGNTPEEGTVIAYSYTAHVTPPFRVDALFAQLPEPAVREPVHTGVRHLDADGWSFQLGLPTRAVEVPVSDSVVHLQVDAAGAARASVNRPGGEGDVAASLATIDAAFARLGIAAPDVDADQVSTSVC